MALIKCPECGKEISDKAESCPHCGCPVESDKPVSHSPLSIAAAIFCFLTVTWIVGLVLALIDLGAYRHDGRKHTGSKLGLIWLMLVAIFLFLLLTNRLDAILGLGAYRYK